MADIANSRLFEQVKGIRELKDALAVIVRTEWNDRYVDRLQEGCIRVLDSYLVKHTVITVPGAVEIPFAISRYWAASQAPAVFIALGCVIRGGTPHFDYVCQSVTHGITSLNLTLTVPVIYGILTVDNMQQADERTGGAHGHKGEEAAMTALKMMILNQQLDESVI